MSLRSVLALIACLALGACASAGSVVTSDADGVAISKQDSRDLNKALAGAGDKASGHCKKFDKSAKLDRTEGVADGVVAYFDCN